MTSDALIDEHQRPTDSQAARSKKLAKEAQNAREHTEKEYRRAKLHGFIALAALGAWWKVTDTQLEAEATIVLLILGVVWLGHYYLRVQLVESSVTLLYSKCSYEVLVDLEAQAVESNERLSKLEEQFRALEDGP
ncbi:MAG TPA: hypothetical protein VN181_06135 [Thermoanaerobaculia bacterium]|nr:hypothetical protein [Thermoanaerobaculia bacterium]